MRRNRSAKIWKETFPNTKQELWRKSQNEYDLH